MNNGILHILLPCFPEILLDSSLKCCTGVGSSPSSQWDFWGSTLVTSSYVRLTPDERSKQGSIWNTVVSKELASMKCILLGITDRYTNNRVHSQIHYSLIGEYLHFELNRSNWWLNWWSNVILLSLCSLFIWKTGRCTCSTRSTDRGRKISMETASPSGTRRRDLIQVMHHLAKIESLSSITSSFQYNALAIKSVD